MRNAVIAGLALVSLGSVLLGGVLPLGQCIADAKPKAKTPGSLAAHARDEAIQAGLRYLERTVFRLPDASGTPRKPFTVAVTGMALLLARDGQGVRTDGKRSLDKTRAYLARYVAEVARRSSDPASLPARNGTFSSDHLIQYTWPLAMAALFHGESHARGLRRTSSRAAIRRIVPLLAEVQAPNGGWGHGKVRQRGEPKGQSVMDGFGAYPDTLVASSNLVATALGLVGRAALPKPKSARDDVLGRAREYFRYAELPNGNFPYDPSQRSAHKSLSGVSRAAGSVLAMRALGIPWTDGGVKRALAFIDEHFDYLSEGHGSSAYNLLLAALMQRSRGGRHWQRFRKVYLQRIVDAQDEEGAFACICQGKAFASTNDSKPFGGKLATAGMPGLFAAGTAAYVTAIHTLILLLDRSAPRLLGKQPAERERGPVTPTAGR